MTAETEIDSARPRISRRSLAAGAAWSVPVVAIAAAAPAMAVSTSWCPTGRFTLRWNAAYADSWAITQFGTDAWQGATPYSGGTVGSGYKINRKTLAWTPLDTAHCANAADNLKLTVDTARVGTSFDSYTCVPGFNYTAARLAVGGVHVHQCEATQSPNSTPNPIPVNWRDGSNLVWQIGAPDGSGNIAGTPEALDLGWNNSQIGAKTWDATATGVPVPAPANYSTWTFTFNKPVTNLQFNVYALDWHNMVQTLQSTGTGPRELVSISPAPASVTKGANVTGSGTAADPWIGTKEGAAAYNDAASGLVAVKYAGPITSFTITGYSNDWEARTSENIFVSNMTMDCPAC